MRPSVSAALLQLPPLGDESPKPRAHVGPGPVEVLRLEQPTWECLLGHLASCLGAGGDELDDSQHPSTPRLSKRRRVHPGKAAPQICLAAIPSRVAVALPECPEAAPPAAQPEAEAAARQQGAASTDAVAAEEPHAAGAEPMDAEGGGEGAAGQQQAAEGGGGDGAEAAAAEPAGNPHVRKSSRR